MRENHMIDHSYDYDVVIIGAGLTGLATAYALRASGLRVALVEKEARLGGVIHTEQEAGFTFEQGPNTGLISTPEVAKLLAHFPQLTQIASAKAKRRLILKTKQGTQRFFPLPYSLASAISTPLFTLRDKLRLLGEPLRKRGSHPEETIASLVKRRMGRSFLDYAIDPFIGGIYAGDPDKLVTKYALPKLYLLEQEHGSFIRGAIAKARAPKDTDAQSVTKEIFSTRGGLSSLIHTLAQDLTQDQLYLSAHQAKITPQQTEGFQINFIQHGIKQELFTHQVVTTVPAPALPSLLPFLSVREDLAPILSLRYAPIVQVVWGVDQEIPQFHAFGGLIPSHEDPYVLGILHPSACFPDRAPEGSSLLSIFLGGMRSPELIDWSDEDILSLVRERLQRILGLSVAPTIHRIYRHRHAIPQYEASSGARFARIKELEEAIPGLHLGGAISEGIGIPDRIKQAYRLARTIATKR